MSVAFREQYRFVNNSIGGLWLHLKMFHLAATRYDDGTRTTVSNKQNTFALLLGYLFNINP